MFATTSRDHTTRIYDLELEPIQQPNNPHWPPTAYPSAAGSAQGLHANEYEGQGLGRCIIVLMGGQSGGHQAAVLGAVSTYFTNLGTSTYGYQAFHPTHPLIATCGVCFHCGILWLC